ncbi:50S ribosomal subunit protein L23 [Candidatus Blochmanniella floridana]|uniref:Large ribosomal subunit protein uL23 n=1 Tax=Blochmanniella floridana TaxID=203907 RepID=RL23_BLOFL|nr:RecName: Full=Large ribosomal subunit protein uL23; AltName: Full=50S ribosomal protein L23 [Candidatus Blochmannia floridanus]CAD83708.1 50S ribosomal subunit protein L23 [Candidatus Blochmannia floridanus]
MYIERLLKVIKAPHVSEKSSIALDKNNVIVLKVVNYVTKQDIRHAVCMLFSVKIKKINVLMVSGKSKGQRYNLGYRCNWKKAYVILKRGYTVDLMNMEQ